MENNLTLAVMQEFIEKLDGMAVLDQDGCYTYVSPGWEEYTGCSAQEALGRKVWDIIPESHASEVFRTGETVVSGLVMKNNMPAFTTYYPRFDKAGNVCGVMLFIILRGRSGADDIQHHINTLTNQVEYYKKELSMERGAKYSLDNIVGQSAAIQELCEQIRLAARSSSTVLIEGETGSGKELIAHAIHTMSSRSSGNFVRVNCAAIPAELMESEFFGYAPGAFTGASKKGKIGRFALADGGSIFLDEVNLLPTVMQPKFLRVLQEREIDPVGGTEPLSVNVRVIAASNLDLERLVEQGEFRRDLFYRLNVIRLTAPPLRQRREDIPLLVDGFIYRLNRQLGMVVERINEEAIAYLMEYDWPGNVRELQNAVESAMNQVAGVVLQKKHFAPFFERIRIHRRVQEAVKRTGYNLATEKRQFEKQLIQEALKAAGGNRRETAELLGISRTMLYNKLEQYQIVDE